MKFEKIERDEESEEEEEKKPKSQAEEKKEDKEESLSDFSFELSKGEMEELKKEIAKENLKDEALEDNAFFRELLLQDMKQKQQINRQMDHLDFSSKINYLSNRAKNVMSQSQSMFES